NGFRFIDYTPEALTGAVLRARAAFENRDSWLKIMENGMSADYSWKMSAPQYLSIYEQAIQLKS
ncbi:MAG TPA: hypothetical protein VI958_03160, partial [Acidobacteriota bacterium]